MQNTNTKIADKVPLLDKFIWSMQGFVASFPWVIVGYYLLYFYTDVMKISAALAGTIMFGARLFDAITDIMIGWAIDNYHFKWGKFRTWVRFSIPANIILWPLVWLSLNNVPITVNIIFAVIGYGCFGAIACTLYYIPTNCQLAAMTKDEGERASLVAWKGVASNFATLLAVAGFMPLVEFLGGSNKGFFLASLVSLVPYIAFLWGDYIISKKYELNEDGSWKAELEPQLIEGKRTPLKVQFKQLIMNRPAIILVIGIFIMYIVQAFRNSSIIYVFTYYFELPEMQSIALTSFTVSSIIGTLAMEPFIKKIKDSNRAYVIWTIVGSLVYIVFYFMSKTMDFESAQASLKYGFLFWLFVVCGFFQGAYFNFAYVLLPMSVDYGVWKYNRNQSGFIYSLNGFSLTFGSSVGAALLGFMLTGIGYAEGVTMTETLKSNLLFISIMVPSLFSIGHAALQLFFGLNEEKYREIVVELKERNKASVSAE